MTSARFSPTARDATAHHEAGHAVAAYFADIPFQHVTIKADADAAGHVMFLRPARGIAGMHKRGIVALAGEAAQRRFNPRSVRRLHGTGDRAQVVAFALDRTSSAEQAELLAQLWGIQARELVQFRWPSIQRVASALLARQVLDGEQVRQLIFSVVDDAGVRLRKPQEGG